MGPYQEELIKNKHKHTNLFCKECDCFLLDEYNSKSYFHKLKSFKKDGCVVKPKIINGKEYHRVRCFDCFFKKFGRIHKPFNIVQDDMIYLFDVTKEEIDLHNSGKASTLENMIRKYGEEEGNKRWKTYCDKQAYSNSFEYKAEKHGWSREQFDEFNSSRAVTLELCIKRHGDEKGTKIFNDYCKKQEYVGCALEYFQEKYGQEEGTKKYEELNEKKKQNLKNYITKYGKDVGQKKWKDYIATINRPYSIISNELFSSLNIQECFYGADNKDEYTVVISEDVFYRLDFYLEKNKKCLEFFGDYWHCNPNIYQESYIHAHSKLFAWEIWEKDKIRVENIKSMGIDILVIWEDEYRKDKEGTIKRCKDFLNN